MSTEAEDRLNEVVEECDELREEHLDPLRAALECVATVENLNDAEANIAEALSEARAMVVKLEALSRSFKEQDDVGQTA